MEKSQKYYLSLLITVILLVSCNKDKKSEAIEAVTFSQHFYQGTSPNLNALIKATELDPNNSEAWREFSIPFLKRGLPHLWKPAIDNAVKLNPVEFIGYRGYNYLWFYRDYKKAIADFDATDTLTPKYIDAPQGHSVDHWRGIAYLGLKNYEKSNWYFEKHITQEIKEFGEDYVDITAFLYNGISYYESGNFDKALYNFDKHLEYSRNLSADVKYYKALIYHKQNKLNEAKTMINDAISDFNLGYFNFRPYVEVIRQIYIEDLNHLKQSLQ